jgi:hypothetical protein
MHRKLGSDHSVPRRIRWIKDEILVAAWTERSDHGLP